MMINLTLNVQRYLNQTGKPKLTPFQYHYEGVEGRCALDIFEREDGFHILVTHPAYSRGGYLESIAQIIYVMLKYNYLNIEFDKLHFYELHLSNSKSSNIPFTIKEAVFTSPAFDHPEWNILNPSDSPFDLSDWKNIYPGDFKSVKTESVLERH